MLSTVINGLLIQDALSEDGQKTYLYTARDISTVGEAFYARKAEKNLSEKKVVIISGGTGNPYFSTDTAGVLRSIEINCDMMIKCTNVDGIYSADPKKDTSAEKYETITYDEVLSKNLRFIDQTAVALAREHRLPIGVCHIDNITKLSSLTKEGEFFGSMMV
jgi:uridylate kinase